MSKQYTYGNLYAAEQQQQKNALKGIEFPLLMGNDFVSPEEINIILGEKAAKRVANWFDEKIEVSTGKVIKGIQGDINESTDGFVSISYQAIGLGEEQFYAYGEALLEAVQNFEVVFTIYEYNNVMDEYYPSGKWTYPELVRHKSAVGEEYNRFFYRRIG